MSLLLTDSATISEIDDSDLKFPKPSLSIPLSVRPQIYPSQFHFSYEYSTTSPYPSHPPPYPLYVILPFSYPPYPYLSYPSCPYLPHESIYPFYSHPPPNPINTNNLTTNTNSNKDLPSLDTNPISDLNTNPISNLNITNFNQSITNTNTSVIMKRYYFR